MQIKVYYKGKLDADKLNKLISKTIREKIPAAIKNSNLSPLEKEYQARRLTEKRVRWFVDSFIRLKQKYNYFPFDKLLAILHEQFGEIPDFGWDGNCFDWILKKNLENLNAKSEPLEISTAANKAIKEIIDMYGECFTHTETESGILSIIEEVEMDRRRETMTDRSSAKTAGEKPAGLEESETSSVKKSKRRRKGRQRQSKRARRLERMARALQHGIDAGAADGATSAHAADRPAGAAETKTMPRAKATRRIDIEVKATRLFKPPKTKGLHI